MRIAATRREYKSLRMRQLDRAVKPFAAARTVARPQRGWIYAFRNAVGLSAAELGQAMQSSRQLPLQLEQAEANDRITLRSLRRAADAMGCDLVYGLVPRAGSLEKLVGERARAQAKEEVLRVEHTMALEDQAAGDIARAVEDEARRAMRELAR
jgi:predicted DNA-binding mobile mystery protein A